MGCGDRASVGTRRSAGPLLATALFFGACACAALAALRLAKRVGTGYARMGDVLAASAGAWEA
ncbi:MAG: hypothetical protein ACLTMP_03045 [Eggerthella lenta]